MLNSSERKRYFEEKGIEPLTRKFYHPSDQIYQMSLEHSFETFRHSEPDAVRVELRRDYAVLVKIHVLGVLPPIHVDNLILSSDQKTKPPERRVETTLLTNEQRAVFEKTVESSAFWTDEYKDMPMYDGTTYVVEGVRRGQSKMERRITSSNNSHSPSCVLWDAYEAIQHI